jgi:nitroreductase
MGREVMDFLKSRRSRPAKLLRAPGPDRQALSDLLVAAARVPDHGKLEPWRFVVIEGAAKDRFVAAIRARAEEAGQDGDKGPSSRRRSSSPSFPRRRRATRSRRSSRPFRAAPWPLASSTPRLRAAGGRAG